MLNLWRVILAFILLLTSAALAKTPDPRDSIILESKVVAPGTYLGKIQDTAAFVYLRVWITNKDSLANIMLPLEETSMSGGAYLVPGYPRNFVGTINQLTYTMTDEWTAIFSRYHGDSPDTMLFAGFISQCHAGCPPEPPNAVRKPFWEIKFDSVLPALGQVQFDTIRYLRVRVQLVDVIGNEVPVNFLKSVVTVVPAPNGDLNGDFNLTPGDVVLALRCIMNVSPPFGGAGLCDLNCDGENTAADLVVLMNAVFLGEPWPC